MGIYNPEAEGVSMKLEDVIKNLYTNYIYDDKNPHMLVSDSDIKILADGIRQWIADTLEI